MAKSSPGGSNSSPKPGRLAEGDRLGSFEILALIGHGGMGEVYRAHDVTLRRDVAIKVLPHLFSDDSERLGRFKREARLLASLDHPNICAVHSLQEEDGTRFIVMPVIEGDTLADRIGRGRLSVGEVLPLFTQIAEALEAAHERGIIHRDLKPSNIKVTEDDKVKILDFGLGKMVDDQKEVSPDLPTMTQKPDSTKMSVEGIILGTPVYMSPEQARGKPNDKRTDIWAFGCCLYEALAGQLPFRGDTVSDILARVLERDPDWDLLPKDTPWRIRDLIEKCLQKNARDRLRDIGDARIDLREVVTGSGRLSPAASATEAPQIQRKRRNLVLTVAVTVLVGTMPAVLAWRLKPEPVGPVVRMDILLPDDREFGYGTDTSSVAVSPDGGQVAFFAWDGEHDERLYLREMDSREAVAVKGVRGLAGSPRYSPDGAAIAFSYEEGLLKVVSLKEGVPGIPTTVCESGMTIGISWAPDGTLVYSKDYGIGLWRVPVKGGEPEQLTDGSVADRSHTWPEVLPHGEGVLYTESSDSEGQYRILYMPFESRESKVVVERGMHPRYVATGHLLYLVGSTLMAAPFDADRVTVIGKPVPLENDVSGDDGVWGISFDVSMTGTLVYVPSREESLTPIRSLVWVDRVGVETPLPFDLAPYFLPRLSPDGARVAVGEHTNVPGDIRVYYFDGRPPLRLTSGFFTFYKVWDPSGQRLVFGGGIKGQGAFGLFTIAADGSELNPKRLMRRANPHSITPDGHELILTKNVDPGRVDRDILALSLDASLEAPPEDSGHLLRPLIATPYNETNASLSHDGKWLAYVSDRSGRREIWVSAYDGSGVPRQISTDGGGYPTWSYDGRELFYLEDDKMMAVPIDKESGSNTDEPETLFEEKSYRASGGRPYDVHPDGRFLMVKEVSRGWSRVTNLVVVQNFFQEIERLAPVDAR